MVSFYVNGHDFVTSGDWHMPGKWSEQRAWQSSRRVEQLCQAHAAALGDDPRGSLPAQDVLLVHDSVIISEENTVIIFFFLLQNYPPFISSGIPFLGHAIAFGKSPIEFLENAYDKVCFPT